MFYSFIYGLTYYRLICYLFIFSFIGWLWETIYVSIKQKTAVNRGFVTGPVCTIYGVGGVSLVLILKPVSHNYFLLFLCGVVITTILEYITASVMERLFHTSWWDYTNERFNIKGRICLKSSLFWGLSSVLLFKYLLPFTDKIIGFVSERTGQMLIYMFSAIYAVDFALATLAAIDISKRLKRVEEVFDELTVYIHTTALYENTEEIRNKLELLRVHISNTNYFKRYSKRLEIRETLWRDSIEKIGMEYSEELYSKISEVFNKYGIGKKWNTFFQHRIMKAYPNIKTRERFLEERPAAIKFKKDK